MWEIQRNQTLSYMFWQEDKQRAYYITDIENMSSGQYLEFPNIKIEYYVVAGQSSLWRGINKSEHFHGCLTTDSPPSIMISVHWGNAWNLFSFSTFLRKLTVFFSPEPMEAMINWLFCNLYFNRTEKFWPLLLKGGCEKLLSRFFSARGGYPPFR